MFVHKEVIRHMQIWEKLSGVARTWRHTRVLASEEYPENKTCGMLCRMVKKF
jgi:hypothetical protein